jgi:hypothetical protein
MNQVEIPDVVRRAMTTLLLAAADQAEGMPSTSIRLTKAAVERVELTGARVFLDLAPVTSGELGTSEDGRTTLIDPWTGSTFVMGLDATGHTVVDVLRRFPNETTPTAADEPLPSLVSPPRSPAAPNTPVRRPRMPSPPRYRRRSTAESDRSPKAQEGRHHHEE